MKIVVIQKIIQMEYELPEHVPTTDYEALQRYCELNSLSPGNYRVGETEVLHSQIVDCKATEEECKCISGVMGVECNRCSRFRSELREVIEEFATQKT